MGPPSFGQIGHADRPDLESWLGHDERHRMSVGLTSGPLVSVVTPFFNTAPYLAECIESVLAQSFEQFEYILMDNCSTDGSAEIAARYASRDPRIKLIRCSKFLSQLANYNRALQEISGVSAYCKIVQADDWIFPECLESMVRAFEQSKSIGMVSAYWLDGDELHGSGLSPQVTMLPGKECVRRYLRTGACPFATQTHVMYRSSLVREQEAFYSVSFPSFADFKKHMEILERWDFGFVHDVLSFSRRDDQSIRNSFLSFALGDSLKYVFARRYAPDALDSNEATAITANYKRGYYRALARAVLGLRGRAFWQFQKTTLRTFNEHETHDWAYLAMITGMELLWLLSNPGTTTQRVLRSLNLRREVHRKSRATKLVPRRSSLSSNSLK
jgi:glycosyltransferase involved in cell wall biosynthesis